MKIKLKFIDGNSLMFNEEGIVLGFYEGEQLSADYDDGFPDVVGLWHDEDKYTIPLEEVIEDIYNDNFQLTPGLLFLDNGQVVEQGEIVELIAFLEDRTSVYGDMED